MEFIELEGESEDPLDQFEDAMEEDDHMEVTDQENHRTHIDKSPENIVIPQKDKTYMEVTDQENNRTHKDKNPENIAIQQKDKTRSK